MLNHRCLPDSREISLRSGAGLHSSRRWSTRKNRNATG